MHATLPCILYTIGPQSWNKFNKCMYDYQIFVLCCKLSK